ncbi:MAG TPA: prepilin-type N-terminal cleavage/methylation domain-containing protein [bacterium]
MRKKGFTLIEVLLVVAILALIMSSVYMTFTSTLKSKTYVEEISNLRQEGRAFMRIFQRNVSAAYLSAQSYVPKQGQQFQPNTFFIGIHDTYNGRDMDRLLFTSLGHMIVVSGRYHGEGEVPIGQSEHAVAGFFALSDYPGVIYLFDAPFFANVPFSDLVAGLLGDLNKYRFPVMDGVVEFSVQYFDWVMKDWKNEWDSTKNNRLPIMVKSTLVLSDSSGREEPFYTLVELPRAIK